MNHISRVDAARTCHPGYTCKPNGTNKQETDLATLTFSLQPIKFSRYVGVCLSYM